MNIRLALLLTHDTDFEKLLGEALSRSGANILTFHTLDDALQTLCARSQELDLAVIDFDHGCHGMTLLKAINACRKNLPILVVTSSDLNHAATLASANGAAACVAKPITTTELELVLSQLREPKLELTAA
jgi:DNA-binding response OmpR family regulator